MGTTDHGITISGSSSGAIGSVVRIGPRTDSIVKVRDTDIEDNDHKYVAGDIEDHAEFEVEYRFPNGTAQPALGTSETWTITHKLGSGQSTAANVAGTGFITNLTENERTVDPTDTVTRTITIAWDGATPPAFTAGSA